jgi:ribosome-binding factor A
MGSRNRRPARRDLSRERDEFLSSLRGESRQGGRAKDEHRNVMFCRQVQRALMLAVAGEVSDDVVGQFSVESVVPAPNCGHLLVSLGVPAGIPIPPIEMLERIERIKPILRRAIAQASSRKRVPELSFVLVPIGKSHEVQP